ncbi:cortical patch protein [Purpureocillium lavendulum]|uniref:Cortical patch protein n=1 Tax=Purpureocillium lavendulum TaxID=1247861 RepID=A0AB34FWR5_9HYPO|nr:cortical patch protein [Purpureocillium lavendulum]
MGKLTASQKAQLHEVADLLLDVYRTLVRMRYLDASWIQQGPHDIDALLPLYRELRLDPAIVYLYSILPYVDPAGAEDVDFFQGGEFADFRKEDDARQGRDPFYSEEDEDALRPWMTPLSMIGNHCSALLYDARKHCIGIFDQMNSGSGDHNLRAGSFTAEEQSDEENGDHEEGKESGAEDSGNESDEGDGRGDDEDQDDRDRDDDESNDEEDEDEEGDQSDEENDSSDDSGDSDDDDDDDERWVDEMDSRPAPDVLRDMIRWYKEFTEVPGGGEHSGPEWSADIITPLYTKHGWPHAHFDGDAFLVDQARAKAAQSAKDTAEEPLHRLNALRGGRSDDDDDDDDDNGPAMQRRRDKLAAAAAAGVDEEYVARWELWHAQWMNQRRRLLLREAEGAAERACPAGVCQKPEELVLWELRQLREDSWAEQRTLKECQQEAKYAEAEGEKEDARGLEIRLRHAERKAETYRRAYEACKADAERECPGRSLPLGRGVEEMGLDLDERLKQLDSSIERLGQDIKSINEWMRGVPEGAPTARNLAQTELDRSEQQLESTREQRLFVIRDLERI